MFTKNTKIPAGIQWEKKQQKIEIQFVKKFSLKAVLSKSSS